MDEQGIELETEAAADEGAVEAVGVGEGGEAEGAKAGQDTPSVQHMPTMHVLDEHSV